MKLTKMKTLVKKTYKNQLARDNALLSTMDENEWFFRQSLTQTRFNQYKNGDIDLNTARKYAMERNARKLEKRCNAAIEKLNTAENREKVYSITISVEWKRSYTWGYNPSAICTIVTENNCQRYYGSASGCGYDKLTAAIAQALNQCEALIGAMYDCKEHAIRKGYRDNAQTNNSNRDCIHYGAGYGALPYFEGGVGWCSFAGLFETLGFKCIASDRNSKNHDFWVYANKKGV